MSQNNIWYFSRMAYEQGALDGMIESLGGMLKPGTSLLDILSGSSGWGHTEEVAMYDLRTSRDPEARMNQEDKGRMFGATSSEN